MTHYETLGVQNFAEEEIVRAAYRALSRKHHPDKGGDAELMRRINGAWEILKDPKKREMYDATLDVQGYGRGRGAGASQAGAGAPRAGFPWGWPAGAGPGAPAAGAEYPGAGYPYAYPADLNELAQQAAQGFAFVVADRFVASLPPEMRTALEEILKRRKP